MTVEELRDEKLNLEKSLMVLVEDFNKRTGTNIKSLKVVYSPSVVPCRNDIIAAIQTDLEP